MKRTFILALSLGLILMLSGMSALAQAVSAPIIVPTPALPFEQALTIAQTAVPDYALMSLSIEDENGTVTYLAELMSQTDGTMLEITLDGASGQILANNPLDKNAEENDGENNGDNVDEQNNDETAGENADEQSDNESVNNANDAVLMAKAVLTQQQAEDIALGANAGAVFADIQLNDENGLAVYGVALTAADGQKFEVKVDAVTGAILPDENQEMDD
jgi:uncharacterized membrane protein YkoI